MQTHQEVEFTSVDVPASAPETCVSLTPPATSFLATSFELRASGDFSISILNERYNPAGKPNSKAASNWPAPGHKEFALLYGVDGRPMMTSLCDALDDGPIDVRDTCRGDVIVGSSRVCFRINDWKLDDNKGSIHVRILAKAVTSECQPMPFPPSTQNPNGGSIPGSSCASNNHTCAQNSECCSKNCNSGVCITPLPAGGDPESGTFSCSGTVTINGEDCAKELGTATTCTKLNGAIACPAVREGCTCSCSLGPCN